MSLYAVVSRWSIDEAIFYQVVYLIFIWNVIIFSDTNIVDSEILQISQSMFKSLRSTRAWEQRVDRKSIYILVRRGGLTGVKLHYVASFHVYLTYHLLLSCFPTIMHFQQILNASLLAFNCKCCSHVGGI